MVMDLVIPVIICNCALATIVLASAIWTLRCRKQAIALAECFDRWERDCARLLENTPDRLATSTKQLAQLQQLYQQQLQTLDRLRSIVFWIGGARSLLRKRKRG
jgi:hypothetical protein